MLAHAAGRLGGAAGLALGAAAHEPLLCGGGCTEVAGVDDVANARALEAALEALGLSEAAELRPLARTLAAVLCLGGLRFEEREDKAALAPDAAAALAAAAEALSLGAAELSAALCTRSICIKGESLSTPRSAAPLVRPSAMPFIAASPWSVHPAGAAPPRKSREARRPGAASAAGRASVPCMAPAALRVARDTRALRKFASSRDSFSP